MSVEPVNWNQLSSLLPSLGYRHKGRLINDLNGIRAAFPDAQPFVARANTGHVFFVVQGTALNESAFDSSRADVKFVVTVPQAYPNAFPIITVEMPAYPWTLRNHPNMDLEGNVYISTITQWEPRRSNIAAALHQLRESFLEEYPFQLSSQPQNANSPTGSSGSTPPPSHRTVSPPPSKPPTSQPGSGSSPYAAPGSVSVAARPIAPSGVPLPQHPRAAPPSSRRSNPPPAATASPSSQRQSSSSSGIMPSQTLGAVMARYLSSNSATDDNSNVISKSDQRKREDLMLLFSGQLPTVHSAPQNVPVKVELPAEFGIGEITVSASTPPDPILVSSPAPYPPAPCPDLRPDQQAELLKQKEKDQYNRSNAAADADSTTGAGWKALSKAGRLVGFMARSAKNKVEDTVRDKNLNRHCEEFTEDFPDYRSSHRINVRYKCCCVGGDGVLRQGRLYIGVDAFFFIVSPNGGTADSGSGIVFSFMHPYTNLVSLTRARCCNKDLLHCHLLGGALRTFTDFETSTTAKIGEWFSNSMYGTEAYQRCWNWFDHAWRARAVVPSTSYSYGPQAIGAQNNPTASAAAPPRGDVNPSGQEDERGESAAAGVAVPQGGAYGGGTSGGGGGNAASDQMECVVCLTEQKNAFFRPCGHVCCCTGCAKQVKQCPLCRKNIDEVFAAFL